MDLLALAAIGFSTFCIAFAVLDLLFSEERRVKRRIDSLEQYTAGSISEAEPLAAPFRDRVLRPGVYRVGRLVSSVTPSGYLRSAQTRIVVAGGSARSDTERLLLAKLIIGVACGAITFTVVTGTDAGLLRAGFAAFVGGAVTSFLPDLYLASRASNRRHHVLRELPDMLDMLTISVEAGLGFDQAVSRYVRHSRGPLGKEFGIALMEIQAGKSRRDALRSMADRADVQELRTFIMAIVQADVFGVSVSEVLRSQSREMRVKRRQHAEELAQKAPAKMAFPLVVCVLPATIIVVITPAIVGLIRLFAG